MNKFNIILHCTENYLKNSLNLIESLRLFHDNLNFYLYTVNFTYKSSDQDIKSILFECSEIENNMVFLGNKNDTSNKNMFKSVFLKSKIVLDTLENLNLDQAIYIDSDILATGEITKIFSNFKNIKDFPLIQQSIYEYQINYGRGNPFHNGGFDETNILEYPLMDFCKVPVKNRTHYSVSSVILYNQSCRQFFRECDFLNSMAFDIDLEQIKYLYPFCDETTINVLLWKYGFNNRIERSQMNIDDLSNVKEFYESNYDHEKEINGYVRIPSVSERSKILFFHGAKGELSNLIIDLQKNLFDVRLDVKDNKLFLTPKVDFNRELKVEILNSGDNIFYTQFSKFNSGFEFWYSPNTRFELVNNFQVSVYDEEKLIFRKNIRYNPTTKN